MFPPLCRFQSGAKRRRGPAPEPCGCRRRGRARSGRSAGSRARDRPAPPGRRRQTAPRAPRPRCRCMAARIKAGAHRAMPASVIACGGGSSDAFPKRDARPGRRPWRHGAPTGLSPRQKRRPPLAGPQHRTHHRTLLFVTLPASQHLPTCGSPAICGPGLSPSGVPAPGNFRPIGRTRRFTRRPIPAGPARSKPRTSRQTAAALQQNGH